MSVCCGRMQLDLCSLSAQHLRVNEEEEALRLISVDDNNFTSRPEHYVLL